MQLSARWRPILTPLNYAGLTLLAAVTLLPFAWMLATALKPADELFSSSFLPTHFEWSNFPRALAAFPFDRWFVNTLFVALSVTFLQLLTSSLAAFSFARIRFPGRDALFVIYLGTMMIPSQVTLVPLFLILKYLGWIDTYNGLIWPAAVSAYGTFLLRQFFLGIPRELEEAARIDGCGFFRIWWQIVLPLARPALATLGLFTFIAQWNSFFWPLIITNSSDMRMLANGLLMFQGQYGTAWELMMAAASVALLPTLAVFVFAQRYFVQGVATTGMGGR